MATCSRCGNPVEFRYVDGRCIPLHIYGSCASSSGPTATDFSGYNISHESACFSTLCPKCGCEVFFIKHNGGSVWIDPPLGPPWYKHPCFENSERSDSNISLLEEYKLSIRHTKNESKTEHLIGIVKATSVDYFKRYTDINFETGESESKDIRLKHNAGFLLGKICLYDISNLEIFPLDEPRFAYSVYEGTPSDMDIVACPKCGASGSLVEIQYHLRLKHDYRIKCPECNRIVTPDNFYDHVKQKHGYSQSSPYMTNCPECGVLINSKNIYKHLVRQHGIS